MPHFILDVKHLKSFIDFFLKSWYYILVPRGEGREAVDPLKSEKSPQGASKNLNLTLSAKRAIMYTSKDKDSPKNQKGEIYEEVLLDHHRQLHQERP